MINLSDSTISDLSGSQYLIWHVNIADNVSALRAILSQRPVKANATLISVQKAWMFASQRQKHCERKRRWEAVSVVDVNSVRSDSEMQLSRRLAPLDCCFLP